MCFVMILFVSAMAVVVWLYERVAREAGLVAGVLLPTVVFIVEQAGRILVHANDAAVTQADVFLDLTSRVTANIGEMGLLGLAFDPDYAQDGKFYVYYLRDNPLESVIAEFRVTTDPDAADPASLAECVVRTPCRRLLSGLRGALCCLCGLDSGALLPRPEATSGGKPAGRCNARLQSVRL